MTKRRRSGGGVPVRIDVSDWVRVCREDPEFRQAARAWNGGLTLRIDTREYAISLVDGHVEAGAADGSGVIVYTGTESVWAEILSAEPRRFQNDLMANLSSDSGLERSGDRVVHAQYYPAIMRAVELLRPTARANAIRPDDLGLQSHFGTPIGHYIHLNLKGVDHRLYYEEAGQGIPLLLQHTAGAHGSQWRHLFEMPEITQRFRLIAYDLPFHGKSLPPVQSEWWTETYRLTGEYLRSIPIELTKALELVEPVFMGCSVGGLLALDLAHRHGDVFRAVISLEGSLSIEGELRQFKENWHPQVSNEYKGRLMEGLMSPTSPVAYRKETGFLYASGWPPVFLGDLNYYLNDYDLTEVAHEIDTTQVGVHILSGEYDYSSTVEMGRAAHAAIKGSTWTEMKGVGHFPMSEDPEVFKRYLLPVLDAII